MEPRAQHVLIGLFTLIAITAAVLFALWLNKSSDKGQINYYRVIFNEPVRGLGKGSTVQYNGIRIGEVIDLHLDANDLRQAHVRVAVDSKIPVHKDTKVQLVMTGITGNAVIEFSGGTPASPTIESTDGIEPTIIATPSSLSQLLEGGDSLISNIGELALSIKTVFSEENVKRIDGILNNLDLITESVADNREDIQSILSNVASTTDDFRSFINKIESMADSADELLSKQGQAVMQGAKDAMQSFQQAAKSLETMLVNSKDSVISATEGMTEIGPALRALRNTLTSFKDIMQKIDENPSGYLLGNENIQEFQP